MRALITGGAGFVGSHLADALLEAGHEIFVIDDLSTGSIDNIAHLKGRPDFHAPLGVRVQQSTRRVPRAGLLEGR